MSLDCGFGSLVEIPDLNLTFCKCEEPYRQNPEFFDFNGFECAAKNIESCLPCDAYFPVIYGLYLGGFVTNLLIVFLMLAGIDWKGIKRHWLLITAFLYIALADLVRIFQPNISFGEDVPFTLFYSAGTIVGIIGVIQYGKRFLAYIEGTIGARQFEGLVKRLAIVRYTNVIVQVIFVPILFIPVVGAAMTEMLNKADLIRLWFIVTLVLLIYTLIVNIYAYNILIGDLEKLASMPDRNEEAKLKYVKTAKKVRAQRNGTLAIYVPVMLVCILSFTVPSVYRGMMYVFPWFNTTIPLITLWMKVKSVYYTRDTSSKPSSQGSLAESKSDVIILKRKEEVEEVPSV